MKARENTTTKRPCEFCGEPTLFTMPLGRRKAVDCCVDCGERPARRNAAISAGKVKV